MSPSRLCRRLRLAKARHNVTCGEELRTAARDESSEEDVVPSQLKVEDTADLEASEEEVSTPEKESATDNAALVEVIKLYA